VSWMHTVNATPTGNTLEKTAGCGTCADAGAVSQQEIPSADGSIDFVPSSTHRFAVGLNTDRGATTSTTMTYTFNFWADTTWDIRETGTYRTGGGFVAGDVFKIAIESGVVKYYRNGTVVYTSTVPPTYPLGFDTSLLHMGSRVTNAHIVK
jgi:hypothetical protein